MAGTFAFCLEFSLGFSIMCKHYRLWIIQYNIFLKSCMPGSTVTAFESGMAKAVDFKRGLSCQKAGLLLTGLPPL